MIESAIRDDGFVILHQAIESDHVAALGEKMLAEDVAAGNIRQAHGCPNCSGTGYRGRKAIFELMRMNAEVRELAFERARLRGAVASSSRRRRGGAARPRRHAA